MLKKISAVLFFCISLPALANSNECGLPDSAIKAYEQNIIDHCSQISEEICNGSFSDVRDVLSSYIRYDSQGLSLDDKVAILAYSFDLYQPVNSALRKHDGSMNAYLPVMNCALSKLPDVNQTVYRNDNLPSSVLDQWQEGATITYDSYMSTTTIPNKCNSDPDEVYCASTKQYLSIHAKHGKNISAYSAYPEEKEVLFLPATKFKITKRSDLGGGKSELILDEL